MKYNFILIGLAFLFSFSGLEAQQLKIWANEGGEKVTQDELRLTNLSKPTRNYVWDGNTLSLTAAKNEVVGAQLIIEAALGASNISVSLKNLTGPGGFRLTDGASTAANVFDWRNKQIELFYIRYLQIKGLSLNGFERYDERHIPEGMRRPFEGAGFGSGGWADRPNHDKFYPEIAVPLELTPSFNIAPQSNQSIWIDIYVPKRAPAGIYSGLVEVRSGGNLMSNVPVTLKVRNFELPDMPTSKTMVVYTPPNINKRFFGVSYVNTQGEDGPRSVQIRQRYFQLAHRHKISLVDTNYDYTGDSPSPHEWLNRLDGSLFTPSAGYEGPGEGTGNNIFSIGTYGSWLWNSGTKEDMQFHTDNWEEWFQQNSPETDRFLYLTDESRDYSQTEQWASWIKENPGPGKDLKSYATVQLPDAFGLIPSLSIVSSTIYLGHPETWDNALNQLRSDPRREFFLYNGHRPASGSFVIEDEGTALREVPWGQFKKGVDRWYFWESTYYDNYLGGQGETNLFQKAHTFGGGGGENSSLGETGWNYSNGDGVLLYPGSDLLFPNESYGIDGPIASLRLKLWRRGIQDADYLALANQVNPTKTQAIIDRMVPKVLWEYGVDDLSDPTYKRGEVSWSSNPDVWEAARAELAEIVESSIVVATPLPLPTATAVRTATATRTVTPTSTAIRTSTATVVPTTSITVPSGGTATPTASATFSAVVTSTPFPTASAVPSPTNQTLPTSVPAPTSTTEPIPTLAPPSAQATIPQLSATVNPTPASVATAVSVATVKPTKIIKGKLKVTVKPGYSRPRFYKEKVRKSIVLQIKTRDRKILSTRLNKDLSFSSDIGAAKLLSIRIKRTRAIPRELILKVVINK